MAFIFDYISYFESMAHGLQWADAVHSPLKDEAFSIAIAMAMMAVSLPVYSVLIWYIDHVFPGKSSSIRRALSFISISPSVV